MSKVEAYDAISAEKSLNYPGDALRNARWIGDAERFAIYLDLENLTGDYWKIGDWEEAHRALDALLRMFWKRGLILVRVAACNRPLAQSLNLFISENEISVLTHGGGKDAADQALLDHVNENWPEHCNVIVIGSGDGAFANMAERARREGKKVEGISPVGGTDTDLYRLLDGHHQIAPPKRLIARRRREHGEHASGLLYGGAVSSRLIDKTRDQTGPQ